MKQSQKFDNILDECLERLLEGETLEQCLQRYPEYVAELEPLLQTAQAVKKASAVQPRTEFRDRARYQFRSALQEMESGRRRWFLVWQSRWATAVAVVLVLLLLGGGVVTVAGNTMPDGALYPVKLATEQVRLALTPSALGKAELYANLADKRVAEIIYMAAKGDPVQVELLAQRLDTHLAMVASLAVIDGRGGATPLPESVREAPSLASQPAPQRMLAPTPAPAAESADEKPGVLAPREASVQPQPAPEKAGEALGEMPPARGEAVKVPEDVSAQAKELVKLREIIKRYAITNPDRLRAALRTAPEPVKPALRRAIQASEKRYRIALEAIGIGAE